MRARTEAEALGDLYELYYERIYRFCIHRLFTREAAEGIGRFSGRSEEDFRCWLYAIAANHANSYIRNAVRPKKHLAETALQAARNRAVPDRGHEPDWPTVYLAISRLDPRQQTLVTLRFFEGLSFEEMSKILDTSAAALRVRLHRILKKLRLELQGIGDGGIRND